MMQELVNRSPQRRSTAYSPEGVPVVRENLLEDWTNPIDGDSGALNDTGTIELPPGMLAAIGRTVLDRIEEMIASMPARPVAPDTTPGRVRSLLPGGTLPVEGEDPRDFVPEAVDLLLQHSTFNGHPRFFGYVTSSAAPLGALADLLASAVNANVGAWSLAPLATEIEAQTIRWLAELVGFPPDCGGLLVSGGNMANITCALAARTASAHWDVRRYGMQHPEASRMVVYATGEAHTWLEKAVDAMGLGTDAIRKVETDDDGRMRPEALRTLIEYDKNLGITPAMVVASAGTVSTGAVDPIRALSEICREYRIWLHVDGAYGAFAAALPEASDDLKALSEVDSVAIDPHKWLYAPLEAGCVLVRNADRLRGAFSYHPPYYHFDGDSGDEPTNYYEWSLQNSRGFRALKVWFILRQLGRSGIEHLIRENIRLAGILHHAASGHPLLQAFRQGLSISTFRYVPVDLRDYLEEEAVWDYLNRLNEMLLTTLQRRGRVYLSKAVLDDVVVLRACIVNFRTRESDVLEVPGLVAEVGAELDATYRCLIANRPLRKE